MTHFFKQNFQFLALVLMAIIIGCDSDNTDIIETDPIDPPAETSTIRITEGGASDDVYSIDISGVAGETVEARVVFTTTDSKQRRMYITQTLPGAGAEPFVVSELSSKGTKADGSIDLDADVTKTLDFTFDLNVPSDITDGSIIYDFWTTTGKGDFRDAGKRLLLGVGTIEVSVGNGNNPDAAVRSYTNVSLSAPLADGSSNTFISLFDNDNTYKISDGAEYVALWDFGYYYGASGLASLASTSDYPSNIVDIVTIANQNKEADEEAITSEELNKTFFGLSTKSSADFDGVSVAADLESESDLNAQTITKLNVGDIVEFLDNYGNRGLIRVNNIIGTNGSTGEIIIDIKVQP